MNQPVLTMHKPRRILVFGNPLFKDDSISLQNSSLPTEKAHRYPSYGYNKVFPAELSSRRLQAQFRARFL
ncbi:MAG: hypothetical protein QXW70_03545 [Candidatus Anstonellales archaeon]